tara:strand:+ start:312 stop:548 length:237 start_codon:yes stop_codon:yes gene_type:complete
MDIFSAVDALRTLERHSHGWVREAYIVIKDYVESQKAVCEACGRVFPSNRAAKTCSDKCRQAKHRSEVIQRKKSPKGE